MRGRTFIYIFVLLFGGSVFSETQPPWKALDGPQAACERPLSLDIGEEYFFEIANDIPGQRAYNELISLYQRKKWDLFDPKLLAFRKAFEKSPLLEAASFLEVQTLFDRIPSSEPTAGHAPPDTAEAVKKAERALRDVLLLFPKSKLAPVVSATAAIHWLKSRRFQRALSFFEASAAAYPDSPVDCVFQTGMGESGFWLGDWKSAEERLSHMLAECRNFRLRTAAELRLAEARWQQGKPGVEAEIEKIIEDQNPYVERFYPAVLFNFGEIKYRKGDWTQAKFYFDRFLKKQARTAPCSAEALKRLADIALMTGEPLDVVAGKYLTVRDAAPQSEAGRFAYAHALLLTLPLAGKAEYARRIKVVDEIVDKFKDENFRSRLFLEKGLAMLAVGEHGALDYLARLKELPRMPLENGVIVDYVRNQISKYADSIQDGPPEILRAFLEANYEPWIKDSLHQSLTWKLYEQASVKLFADRIEENKFDEAFEILENWKQSDFWPEAGPSDKARDMVSVSLLRGLFASEGPEAPLALDLLQRGSIVRPFLEPDFNVVEIAAASQVGDEKKMKDFFDSSQRQLASVTPSGSNSVAKPYLMMARARALRDIKRFAQAEEALKQAGEIKPAEILLKEKLALYEASGDFPKAYSAGVDLWKHSSGPTKRKSASRLYRLVNDGKLWDRAPELLEISKKTGVEGKELAPYYFLAARAFFEKKRCREAIDNYEAAFHLDPESLERAEGRFRLGKCLFTDKKPEAARQQWEKVVQLQDSFWSPLAKNELKLLPAAR